jgi:hypothetical protein
MRKTGTRYTLEGVPQRGHEVGGPPYHEGTEAVLRYWAKETGRDFTVLRREYETSRQERRASGELDAELEAMRDRIRSALSRPAHARVSPVRPATTAPSARTDEALEAARRYLRSVAR